MSPDVKLCLTTKSLGGRSEINNFNTSTYCLKNTLHSEGIILQLLRTKVFSDRMIDNQCSRRLLRI